MTLTRNIELAILADFNKVALLAQFSPRPHDYPGSKAGDDNPTTPEQKVTITVSAQETGEQFGTGIKKVKVTVEIRAARAADPDAGTLLDTIEESVSSRLQPSYPIAGVTGREAVLSSSAHKVFGIQADGITRTESNLERIRNVGRVFIAALLP